MIPPDLASSLRQILPDQLASTNARTQAVVPAQKLADVLSNLVPGQRVLAEIQALLPNGTYRAIVAQRDITLALPFSAKAGDSLELEVVETNGKVALAFVANRSSGEQASKLTDSAATTLSQTGKLIGDLLNGVSDQGKRAAPAALNGNQPLVEKFPDQAANLAPILKDALTKSGVFYEAHQARWVAGELPTAALKQEPQGRFATAAAIMLSVDEQGTPSTTSGSAPVNTTPEAKTSDAGRLAATYGSMQNSAPPLDEQAKSSTTSGSATVNTTPEAKTSDANRLAMQGNQQAPTPGTPIPRDLVPIVQQQLDALATQNYAWQGQIWPGQQMQWEIGENPDGKRSTENDAIARWQTRLKLALPMLGGINAVLNLNPAGEVNISVTADSASSETRLRDNATLLSQQMESAGLKLTLLLVEHGETTH